ncbi:MAG TPA: site-specific tyrosine recombinase/integron integrase [Candidatus Nanoarchaeia archaeon]|nr:site-specific tyrosine recombinase/integron integrase [Candidatus Nanoarchaeia archaeon]
MLSKLETELKIRNYSPRTIKAYLIHNRKFLEFIKKSPEEITTDDVKSYMAFLSDRVSARSRNLVLSSLAYFYSKVLKKNILAREELERPKIGKKLPTVLSRDEIEKLISVPKNFKHRILIKMMYGSGLRVSECVKIKIEDIDLQEKTGRVQGGKGNKDRNIYLSEDCIKDIQEFLATRKGSNPYLFNVGDHHICARQAQKIVQHSAREAGIKRRVFCHALRSSYATHLLEDGTDIRVIQTLLGHEYLETTQIYTKVSTAQLKKVKSPLDMLLYQKKNKENPQYEDSGVTK